MQEIKDPAITLFGKKIPFPGISDESGQSIEKERSCLDGDDGEISEKDSSSDKNSASAEKEEQESSNLQTSEVNEDAGVSNPERTKSMEEETDSKSEKEQNDPNKANNSQDQSKPVLKKPDKILPCPRCNSMDTKFCYYNNYNINQPRHFCKACQRYWTAGGTMRNVPVGAGRRKNKNSSSSSHYQHISISEAIQAARIDASQNGMLKTNGRVLSFGLDAQHAPICNSMASVLKLGDQKVLNGATRNGFNYVGDQGNGFSCRMVENGNDCSGGPSTAMSNINLTDESGGRNCTVQETTAMNMNGFSPHIPCLPGIPWPYPWNSAIPPPGFFPMPFYPYWSVPVLSPQSSSSSHKGSSLTGPNSPTLGKHSREEDAGKLEEQPKQRNGSVLIPKTLRFDDPNEAAKSSIWATLGIKNDFLSKGGMFKGFEPKNNEKIKENSAAETSPALSANPAALSRSLVFHERI